MHDCTDWPVAFLGAIKAGIVPVPLSRDQVKRYYEELVK